MTKKLDLMDMYELETGDSCMMDNDRISDSYVDWLEDKIQFTCNHVWVAYTNKWSTGYYCTKCGSSSKESKDD